MKKNFSLMKKLILYFLLIIIVMFALNAYSMYGFRSFYSNFYSMLTRLVETHSVSLDVDELFKDIENYAHSGTQEYLDDYKTKLAALKKRITVLKAQSTQQTYYKYRDIENMLLTFDEKSRVIAASYKAQVKPIYINQAITELNRVKGYIHDEVKNILLIHLLNVQACFSGFHGKMKNSESIIYLLTILITLMCLGAAVKFSREISVPIHQLVLRLQRVSNGELNVDAVDLKTNDEINVLINSFNHMIVQIRKLIDKIREKANIEKQLKEQEIKNLEISNLLNQSELNFLQSQINPHFLFNTMNSIAVLADIEEAPQTKLMLESMSSILRYNLKKLNETVTLGDEYEIIKSYLYIQRMRFGNRIEQIVEIDESALDIKVPSMILQPFVENAIIHGLEPKEGNGTLEFVIRDFDKIVEIIIRDNGIGIPEEKLRSILDCKDPLKNHSKSGIGVSNVLRRLEITYGRNIVEINSREGKGTEVKMRLAKSALDI